MLVYINLNYVYNHFLLMEPVSVPDLSKCLAILGFTEGAKVHSACLSIEFRSASSLTEQIHFVQTVMPTINIRNLCNVLNISSRRYYKAIKGEPEKTKFTNIPPPTQLLTLEEENSIIDSIRKAQLNNDCMTGKEIRVLASRIYTERTKEFCDFSRDWYWRFLQRHSNKMKNQKSVSTFS